MKVALPGSYLAVLERARRPGASPNERALAHVVDALLVLLLCAPDDERQESTPAPADPMLYSSP